MRTQRSDVAAPACWKPCNATGRPALHGGEQGATPYIRGLHVATLEANRVVARRIVVGQIGSRSTPLRLHVTNQGGDAS